MVDFKIIDKVGMPHVLNFIMHELRVFDTSSIEWIKLLPLSKNTLLHGECRFPPRMSNGTNKKRGYRIRASVNVEMAPPFSFVHWGWVRCSANKEKIVSGEKTFEFSDLEECALHTLAHECFHFLSDSNQILKKNIEANANAFADEWLNCFRNKM